MMGTSTKVELHKAAKNHICDYCGEKIILGETYKRWRWFDSGDASTVKIHPECFDAFLELDSFDQEDGFRMGENPRGCNCGFNAHCDRCSSGKSAV